MKKKKTIKLRRPRDCRLSDRPVRRGESSGHVSPAVLGRFFKKNRLPEFWPSREKERGTVSHAGHNNEKKK